MNSSSAISFGRPHWCSFEFRSDDDDGTAGVVDALAQQVLAEAALFALQQVGQRLQCPVSGTRHRTAAPPVVDQSVHRLLKHAFFISDDDLGRTQRQQLVEPVVAVDDPAIQIIQIGCGKSAAVQLHHRAQVRRQDRQDIQNHPLGAIPGFLEGFHHFQPLDQPGFLLTGCGLEFLPQAFGHFVNVNVRKKFLDGFGAHGRAERVAPALFLLLTEFAVGQDLLLDQTRHFLIARVQDNVGSEIQHTLQNTRGQIEDQTHAARDAPEIPDVRDGSRQTDVPPGARGVLSIS